MSSQTGNIRPTFSLPFSTLSEQSTATSSSPTPTTSSGGSGIPTPSLSFGTVPSQLDTCTSFNIVWSLEGSYEVVTSGSDSDTDSDGDGGGKGSGKGGGDDDNDNDSSSSSRSKSKSDSDSSTDISPTSILSIGIAGSYIPPGGIVNQLSYTIFTDVLEANIGSGSGSTSGSSTGTSSYNYTFEVIVPPGIYDFFAILTVTSDSDGDNDSDSGGGKDVAQSTQTFSFVSNTFGVVNGSDTNCVNYALPNDPDPVTSLPIPTSTPTTSGTSLTLTSSNNPTSSSSSGSGSGLPGNPILSGTNKTSLTHGAVAGIAVGSILGVLAILLLGLFYVRLRRRHGSIGGSRHTRSPTRSEFKPSVGELGYEDSAGGGGWTTTRNVGNRDGSTGAGLGTGQGRSHVRSGSLGSNISSIIGALRPGTAGSLGSLRRGAERDNANFVGLRSVDSSRGGRSGSGGGGGGRGHHANASPTTPTGPIIPTLANVADANRDVDNDSDSKSLATTYEGPDAIISQIPPTPHTLPYTGVGTFTAAAAAAAPYLGQFQHHQVRSGSEIGDHYETDVQAAGVYSGYNAGGGYRGYSGYSYDRDGYRDSGASTLRTHLLNPSVETDGGSRRESSNAPITPITPTTPSAISTSPTTTMAATSTTTQAKRRTYITRKPVPSASLEEPEAGPRMSTSTLSHHHGGASTVDSHTGLTPTTTSGSGSGSATTERMGRTGAATASSTSVTPVIGHGSGSSSRHSHDHVAGGSGHTPVSHNFDPADLPSLNHKSSMGFEGREVHYLIPDLPSEGLGG